MNRSAKLGLLAPVLIALAVLLYAAVSSGIFFTSLYLVVNVEADSSGSQSFYMYINSHDSEPDVKVATLTMSVERSGEDMAHVTLEITPQANYELDGFHYEIKSLASPPSLITDGSSSLNYSRTDGEMSVTLDFPDQGSGKGEAVAFEFWLDLSQTEPAAGGGLLMASLRLHEGSVFKIVSLKAYTTMVLSVPYSSQ